jgi:hypothetical protein
MRRWLRYSPPTTFSSSQRSRPSFAKAPSLREPRINRFTAGGFGLWTELVKASYRGPPDILLRKRNVSERRRKFATFVALSGRLLESNVSIDFHASITALFYFDGLSDRSSVRFYAVCSHVKHSVAMSVDSGFIRFDLTLVPLNVMDASFPIAFNAASRTSGHENSM